MVLSQVELSGDDSGEGIILTLDDLRWRRLHDLLIFPALLATLIRLELAELRLFGERLHIVSDFLNRLYTHLVCDISMAVLLIRLVHSQRSPVWRLV